MGIQDRIRKLHVINLRLEGFMAEVSGPDEYFVIMQVPVLSDILSKYVAFMGFIASSILGALTQVGK